MPSLRLRSVATALTVAFFTLSISAQDQVALPVSWLETLKWRSIGPAVMGGRITAMAVSQQDSSRWWAATASGGLLRTTNNGTTLEHQFDKEEVVSIGDVAVAPSNHDIVWVGTGESNPRNSASWGRGVYKSEDGGKSWKHQGLEKSFQIGRVVIHPTDPNVVYVGALGRLWGAGGERGLYKTVDGGKTWERIHFVDEKTGVIELKMHPKDADTLLMATWERKRDAFDGNDPEVKWGEGAGLWKTTDGGKNWKRITAGLPSGKLGRIGLDYWQKNPDVVFALVESDRIGMLPEKAGWIGLRAENADAAAKITRLTENGPAAKAGLLVNDLVISVDGERVLKSDDLTVAARQREIGAKIKVEYVREGATHATDIVLEKEPRPEPRGGQGASTAQGAESSDETAAATPPARGGLGGGGRDTDVTRPLGTSLGGQNPNQQRHQALEEHEFGGLYKSTDGGESWKRINSNNPRPMYFSQVRVDPNDDQLVWILGISLDRSKDGGTTFTTDGGRGTHADHHAMWIDPRDGKRILLGNDGGIYQTYDRGDTWDHLNHVALGQFYHVDIDTNRNYRLYGGLQDNGSWGGPMRSAEGSGGLNEDWFRIGGGDGFVCRVDPTDPNQIYCESQNGSLSRRHLDNGERGSIRPEAARGERLRFNWNTPFILSAHNPKIYYVGANFVFRSLDRGRALKKISPEITRTDRGSATVIAESPVDADLLFVGTDDGAVWRTKNGGVEWTELSRPPAPTPDPIAKAPEGESPAAALETRIVAEIKDTPTAEVATTSFESERPESPNRGADFVARLLERDANGDGKLQKTEVSERMSGMFERMDTNADGALDTTELAAMNNRGGPGGRRGQRGEGGTSSERPNRSGNPDAAPTTNGNSPPASNANLKSLGALLPGPRWVSAIVCSRTDKNRVCVSLDGHRSDDDGQYLFVSEDGGDTWTSILNNLPPSAGSIRTLSEDITNSNILYCGTEFSAWVSIDRGSSWTKLNSNLPTVAVHAFAQHPTSGEIVAATHGRSLWILDVTPLRQMTKDLVAKDAHFYKPPTTILWKSAPARGGTNRRFVGENPANGARLAYSLGKNAREVTLEVRDTSDNLLRVLETKTTEGLHTVTWDLRRSPPQPTTTDPAATPGTGRPPEIGGGGGGGGRGGPGGRGNRGRRVAPGTYKAILNVDGTTLSQEIIVQIDPDAKEGPWLNQEGFFGGEDEADEENLEVEHEEPELAPVRQ